MNLLVLTTVPHLLTIFYTFDDILYSSVIMMATFSSILWHSAKEPVGILRLVDYIFATLLTSYEISCKKDLDIVLALNFLVLITNKMTSCNCKLHCLWHLLSSIKCIYVARNLK
jgi:hypothetical protein